MATFRFAVARDTPANLAALWCVTFWLINQKKLQTVVELGDRDAHNAAEQDPLNPQAKTTTEAA